jgi:DNA invertase Pin-like site-specific DNA recombinase
MIAREIVAYCRVSSHEQGLLGLGMEAQLAAIREYADRSNARIVAAAPAPGLVDITAA